jgi:hypothetical protein
MYFGVCLDTLLKDCRKWLKIFNEGSCILCDSFCVSAVLASNQ